ncbi:MAG TPA: globin domain-containing protein [Verrucomicrobiae bacterium]|nr:globin domain-containing protein [Verrucomicrobiae bacterium]
MTEKQIHLLRESFALIQPKAVAAGLTFYRNLFALDPSLRAMFQSSIELQSRKLMEALSYTIATLENPKALVPMLEAMGRRHVSYGTRDEHYATVLTALLGALEETLGAAYTPETRKAWTAALGFVADTMKRGAAETQALRQEMIEK